MAKLRVGLFAVWGASAGFVVGAACVAWLYKQVGAWPRRNGGR